jgi:anti-anti-sigma factor
MTPLSELALDRTDDDVVVARVSGEIDLSNAQDLRSALVDAVPNSALGLVVDLTATTYLDSSGVHLLFDLAERLRRRQQQLGLAVPEGASIRRVLRIVDMGGAVPLVATVDEAVAGIRASA